MPRPTPHALLDKLLVVLLLILSLPPRALLSIRRHLKSEPSKPDAEAEQVDESETGLCVAWDRVDEVDRETGAGNPCCLTKPGRYEKVQESL